jgi:hypothetical protein
MPARLRKETSVETAVAGMLGAKPPKPSRLLVSDSSSRQPKSVKSTAFALQSALRGGRGKREKASSIAVTSTTTKKQMYLYSVTLTGTLSGGRFSPQA